MSDDKVRDELAYVLHSAWLAAGPLVPTVGNYTDAILASGLLDRIRAEAWDEGYTSGHSNAMRRMSDEPNAPATPNPYRATA